VKALLLAAGEGKRLDPFTRIRPKPVLPLANRPLILHLLDSLKEAGIEDIGVVSGYRAEKVHEALQEAQTIRHFVQGTLDGPLGAVLAAREFFTGTTILICADNYVSPDLLGLLIAGHRGESVTVAAGETDTPLYGYRCESDGSGRLLRTIPVQGNRQVRQGNMLAGIAVVEPSVVDHAARAPDREWGSFFGWLARQTAVRAIQGGFELADMDYPWQMHQVNAQAVRRRFLKRGGYIASTAAVHPSTVLEGRNVIEDGVKIEAGCVIRDSWIGAGTIVLAGSYVQDGFIGADCELGPGCFVAGGTCGSGSRIGFNTSYKALGLGQVGFWHECHVVGTWDDKSTASANCCSCSSRHDGLTVKVKIDGEMVESGLFAVSPMVGYGAALGPGVNLMPGRKMGPYSVAGPDLVVYHDLPASTHVVVRQQLEYRERKIDECAAG
jgi:NDP-sugar pyrophosphorylase family protein